jgi:WD40 repeat protein
MQKKIFLLVISLASATSHYANGMNATAKEPTGEANLLASISTESCPLSDSFRTELNNSLRVVIPHSSTAIAFDPKGTQLLIGKDSFVKLYDLPSKSVCFDESHPDEQKYTGAIITSVFFNPEKNSIIAGGSYGGIAIWNRTTKELEDTINQDSWAIVTQWCNNGSSLLVALKNRGVTRWDFEEGEITFSKEYANLEFAAFSNDGSLMALGAKKQVTVWDVKSNTLRWTLEHETDINALAVSPDGSLILVGTIKCNKAYLWSNSTGKLLYTFQHDVKVDPNAPSIKSSLKRIRIISEQRITSVSFNSDGTKCATGSYNSGAKIWSTSSGKLLHKLPHNTFISSIAFSPDEEKIVIGGGETTLWDLKGLEVLASPNSKQSALLQELERCEKNSTPITLNNSQWDTFKSLPEAVQTMLGKCIIAQ